MKLSIEKILDKVEELNDYEITSFISSLDLTSEQMELLADHEDDYVRMGLAENPNLTSEKVMLKLASDKDVWVKKRLARNPNLTERVTVKLGSDEYYIVRFNIAQNPNLTSEKVMVKLSNDEDRIVKEGLAENPNLTSEKVMIKLSSDEEANVRWELAQNPNLTEKVMIKLSSDESVSDEAFEQLEKLNSLSSEDLESAYDLINNSKHIGRENFKKTFDYIANKFPELSELAKMFKRIILKGKRDL